MSNNALDYAIAGTMALANIEGYRPISFSGAQFVYAKTNLAGFFFDAVMRVEHTKALRITEHPLQTGANISDHAFMLPAYVTLEISMSDTMATVIPGQFGVPSLGSIATKLGIATANSLTGGTAGKYLQLLTGLTSAAFPRPSKSVNAYQVLKQLQALRLPLSLVTRLDVYENMLIEQITAPDDYTTSSGLKAIVTLKQLLIAVVPTQKVSARKQATNKTDKGPVQTQTGSDNGSAISQLGDRYGKLFNDYVKGKQ